MNIIIVSTEPPDPFGNAAGRWYYVLAKGLSARGSHVRWLSAYSDKQSAERAKAYLAGEKGLELTLHAHPKRSVLQRKLHTLRRPYSYFLSADLREAVERELRHGYDILQLEQTWAGWLGMGVPRALLSVHWLARVDLAAAPVSAPRLIATAALMQWTERRIIRRFRTIRVLTQRDCQIVKRMNEKAHVTVIPLGLDYRLYEFSNEEPPEPTIGLIGSMQWLPTRSAAIRLLDRIWPRAKQLIPELKVLVGGWEARRALARYLGKPDVTIVENVADAGSFLRRLSLLVFPLDRGSGTKVKVLEAMAYGVPVVTTQEGIEGIAAVDGVHALIADDDEDLAGCIAELIADRQKRQAVRQAARRLIEEEHSPASTLTQMETLYQEIAR